MLRTFLEKKALDNLSISNQPPVACDTAGDADVVAFEEDGGDFEVEGYFFVGCLCD